MTVKKPLPPRESEIQKDVLNYLKILKEGLFHFDYFRMNLGGVMHSFGQNIIRKKNPNEGMADILVLYEGRAIWIEVKRPKLGRQSESQKNFERRCIESGCIYKIVTSVEDCTNFFTSYISEIENEENSPENERFNPKNL